jgi:hypothetical protein
VREITGRDELTCRSRPGPAARLTGLVAALSGDAEDAVRALSLLAWEERLLGLRGAVIGPRIEAELACPECGAGALLAFSAADLPREATPIPDAGMALHVLSAGDIADLETAGLAGEDALAFLLARAGRTNMRDAAEVLRGPRRTEILAALEALCAGLALVLRTQCIDCGLQIAAPFDVAVFFDTEIGVRAARLIDEVHVIATSYHWSEAEILDLPFARRQAYLARILGDSALAGHAGAVA